MPPNKNPKGWTPLKDLNNFVELIRLNDVQPSDYQLTQQYFQNEKSNAQSELDIDETLLGEEFDGP